MQNIIMPFGKYKGKDLLYIMDTNPKYMLWLNTLELKGKLQVAIPALIETKYFHDSLEAYIEAEELYLEGLRECSEIDLY